MKFPGSLGCRGGVDSVAAAEAAAEEVGARVDLAPRLSA